MGNGDTTASLRGWDESWLSEGFGNSEVIKKCYYYYYLLGSVEAL